MNVSRKYQGIVYGHIEHQLDIQLVMFVDNITQKKLDVFIHRQHLHAGAIWKCFLELGCASHRQIIAVKETDTMKKTCTYTLLKR